MSFITPASGRIPGTGLHLRGVLVVGALLALGAAFSIFNVNLVRSADSSITVAEIDVAVPASDPFSAIWERSPLAEIPLSAQQIWQPGGGSVQSVQVRALQDGDRIAFLVSWADDSQNLTASGQLPSDAAAIQLPMDPANLPYQCMGQPTNPVNIWQWRAANEVTAKASEGAIPYNGMRNLVSHGLGKADEAQGVHPTGNSVWRDGRWYLIFSRNLAPLGAGTAPLVPGETTNAAFAIWDGAKGETRAMKAVSTWTPVSIGGSENTGWQSWVWIGLTIVVSVVAITLGARYLPK